MDPSDGINHRNCVFGSVGDIVLCTAEDNVSCRVHVKPHIMSIDCPACHPAYIIYKWDRLQENDTTDIL